MLLIWLIGLVVAAIVATVLTEVESFGWATLLLIGSVVAMQSLHVADLWGFVSTHAALTLLYVVAYVGTGIAWSFVKWFSFLMKVRDKYREAKEKYLAKHGLLSSDIPADKLEEFQSSFRYSSNYDLLGGDIQYGMRPRASGNKARILSWMSLWPCSMIGTVLNDPVRRMFHWMFNTFKALYQKMSDRVFAKDYELK